MRRLLRNAIYRQMLHCSEAPIQRRTSSSKTQRGIKAHLSSSCFAKSHLAPSINKKARLTTTNRYRELGSSLPRRFNASSTHEFFLRCSATMFGPTILIPQPTACTQEKAKFIVARWVAPQALTSSWRGLNSAASVVFLHRPRCRSSIGHEGRLQGDVAQEAYPKRGHADGSVIIRQTAAAMLLKTFPG